MLPETSLFNIFSFFFFASSFIIREREKQKENIGRGRGKKNLNPPQDWSYFQSAAKEFLEKKIIQRELSADRNIFREWSMYIFA